MNSSDSNEQSYFNDWLKLTGLDAAGRHAVLKRTDRFMKQTLQNTCRNCFTGRVWVTWAYQRFSCRTSLVKLQETRDGSSDTESVCEPASDLLMTSEGWGTEDGLLWLSSAVVQKQKKNSNFSFPISKFVNYWRMNFILYKQRCSGEDPPMLKFKMCFMQWRSCVLIIFIASSCLIKLEVLIDADQDQNKWVPRGPVSPPSLAGWFVSSSATSAGGKLAALFHLWPQHFWGVFGDRPQQSQLTTFYKLNKQWKGSVWRTEMRMTGWFSLFHVIQNE